ncbi:glycerate kinase [Yeosuana marina]|uniref:glycerate kinase n=1 Tax=Yeosuana marina TaxID=1565536 RepID=UPI0030C7B8B1
MKFVIAPDKFKGSLTAIQFCNAVESSLKRILPNAEIYRLPLSDGGDGIIDILEYHLHGKRLKLQVNNPLFRSIQASYLNMDAINTAFIEMAAASGIALLKPEEQNCFYTTSLGTGELIKHAIKKGAKTIILGIGGSATNDCGIGMAAALGYTFEDERGKELRPIGKNLSKIHHINTNTVLNVLDEVEFKVACDVTNPLFGKNGAAYVYGPQKGASSSEIAQLDEGLQHLSKLFIKQFDRDIQNLKGAGAAGGMGAGASVFLNAELQSGITLVKDLINFDAKINNADWVITGEGKLDAQTLSGKTIHGVITSAKAKKIKVAAFCGAMDLSDTDIKNFGIDYADAVLNYSKNLEDAMKNGYSYVEGMAEKFAKMFV